MPPGALIHPPIHTVYIQVGLNMARQLGHIVLQRVGVTVNSYPCQLAPCQLVPMSTRTINRYQLVPQVMSTRIQQGRYQMMVRADLSYHTTDVDSYPCQLILNSYHSYYSPNGSSTIDYLIFNENNIISKF